MKLILILPEGEIVMWHSDTLELESSWGVATLTWTRENIQQAIAVFDWEFVGFL